MRNSPVTTEQAIGNLLKPIAAMLFLFWALGGNDVEAAGNHEPLNHIRQAALTALKPVAASGTSLKVTALDNRLALSRCDQKLNARVASQSGSSASVLVSCPSKGWKLYVPVNIHQTVQVLISARALHRGETLKQSDFLVQTRDRVGLGPAWVSSASQLSGKVLKRPVSAGTVLTPALLKAEQIIKRGQQVTITSSNGYFAVRATGKAMSNGAAGEMVRVQNLSSRKIVEGTVLPDGTVAVRL